MKRRRFISSRSKTTSFHQPSFPKIKVSVCRPILQRGGEGRGGGEDRAASPAAVAWWIGELTRFRSYRRRPVTPYLDRQARSVDVDGGRRRRRLTAKQPCGMLRRRRRLRLAFLLLSASFESFLESSLRLPKYG